MYDDMVSWISELTNSQLSGYPYKTASAYGGSGSKSGSSGGSSQNSSLQKLIDQFTAAVSAGNSQNAWRRSLPTDTTQLLRQLSANVGELGMPGGYVGAVQMPSYQMPGPQLPAINNPNMATYGRQPGYGEATFYQQSMKGGMTPIAAMSPLGVPEGWNPGGGSSNYTAPSSSLQSLIDKYKASPTSISRSDTSSLQKQIEEYLKKISSTPTTNKRGDDDEED